VNSISDKKAANNEAGSFFVSVQVVALNEVPALYLFCSLLGTATIYI
jgi:hypothetical protein